MMRAVSAGVLLLAAAQGSGAAQQTDSLRRDTLRFRLQPVAINVLRGTAVDLRTPAAVTAVSRAALQDAQLTVGLDEALAVVPGVVVNNRGTFAVGSRIAVRGLGVRAQFGVRGVRMLQDGIPLTMPDGQTNINNLDLGSAGRIEVLRGPASSLYGNAAGGVIAIETEPAPAVGFAGELRTVGSDVGRDAFKLFELPEFLTKDLTRLTKHQVKVGGRVQAVDYLLSAARFDTDGFRAHSQAEQTSLNTRVRLSQGSTAQWTFLLNFIDAPVAQNPGSLPLDSAAQKPTMAWPVNVSTGAGNITRQAQAGIAYKRGNDRSGWNASLYGLTRTLDNPLTFGYITLDRRSTGARASYARTGSLSGRTAGLIVGADLEYQSDERGEFNNVAGQRGTQVRRNQTDRVTTAGPFVQSHLALLPRLELTLGARYDLMQFEVTDRHLADGRNDSGERTLSALSPRAALLYALNEDASAYASIGTAFQTPTTTELINRPPAPGAPCCPGGFNRALEPQRALNLELGVKGQLAERVRYEAAIYQMSVQDPLVSYQIQQVVGRDFFRNAGETRHRGFEGALAVVITPTVLLETAYTYSDFVFIDDGDATQDNENNLVPGVPPQHLFARLRLKPHRLVSLEIEDEYTDDFFVNDANTARNESANVIDVRLQLELEAAGLGVRPFLAVNNVLDESYNGSVVINAAGNRYYEPAPGRNLYLGAAVRFGGW
jgi:iron complex outermembrane receptor protein